MAANRILEECTAFLSFVHSGFKYNLQILPDTLTASTMLFALLLQSPPFAALAVGLIGLNLVQPLIALFFTSYVKIRFVSVFHQID